MQKIEALHAAVAQGSLREVQAMLGRAKLALSKVKMGKSIRMHNSGMTRKGYSKSNCQFVRLTKNQFVLTETDNGIHPVLKLTCN